jgi:selenide, water dikinase
MKTEAAVRLTQFAKGSGCGCKIAPSVLEKILSKTDPGVKFPSLVASYETMDDASVWELEGNSYLLSTVDFFTPIVDDPFDFGRIAAANSLSDIYAMGGRPAFALAILGFPIDTIDPSVAATILDGARSVCTSVGVPIAGGHSIDVPEPIFGLTVNGFVNRTSLKTNSGARPGDLLFLTKPLGTGIVSAALKRNQADEEDVENSIRVMAKLNDAAIRIAGVEGVSAMTDVTGFGLLGHLIEMCEGSGVSATLDFGSVPLLPGVKKYIDKFIFPDNTYRNWNAFEKKVRGVNGPSFIPLCDPQTSGGLLFSVAAKDREQIIRVLESEMLHEHVKSIGTVTEKEESVVTVVE